MIIEPVGSSGYSDMTTFTSFRFASLLMKLLKLIIRASVPASLSADGTPMLTGEWFELLGIVSMLPPFSLINWFRNDSRRTMSTW